MRLDEESGTATEDEDDVRARELRKQEVWLKVPSRESDTETGSETEVKKSTSFTTTTMSPLSELSTASSDKLSLDALTINEVDVDINGTREATIKKVLDNNLSNDEHLNADKNFIINNNGDGCYNSSNISGCCSSSSNNSYNNGNNNCSDDRISVSMSEMLDKTNDDIDNKLRGDCLNLLLNENNCKELKSTNSLPDLAIQRDDSLINCDRNNALEQLIDDRNFGDNDNLPDLIILPSNINRQQFILASDQSFDNDFIDAKDDDGNDNVDSKNECLIDDYNDIIVKDVDINQIKLKNEEENHVNEEKKIVDSKDIHNETMDSFDILKQELRLRRNKKHSDVAQLRPLSRETARTKMNQYFDAMKKEELNCESRENIGNECSEVEIKAHVSDKIDSKDLQKYFKANSIELTDNNEINLNSTFEVVDSNCLDDLFQNDKSSLSSSLSSSSACAMLIQVDNTRPNEVKNIENCVEKISVIEKEFILPRETILITSKIESPKKPERKRISNKANNSIKSNKTDNQHNPINIMDNINISKSKFERKINDTQDSNRPIASTKFGKVGKKSRGEQDANKKEKCIIS